MSQSRADRRRAQRSNTPRHSFPWWLVIIAMAGIAIIAAVKVSRQEKSPAYHIAPTSGTVYASAQMALRDLVQTHPSPKISHDLDSLIVTGIVVTNYQEEIGFAETCAGFFLLPRQDGKWIPALNINQGIILDPAKRRFNQLVILHEFRHYEQWRDGLAPSESFASVEADKRIDAKEAGMIFHMELDAYCMECEFAKQQGWLGAMEFSDIYIRNGRRALCTSIAEAYAQIPYFSAHADVYRKIAATF